MKIGDLQDHCGTCKLIDYCTEPYETPHLCAYEELEDVDEETYKQIVENVTEEEIKDKLKQYEENNISLWTDNRNGRYGTLFLKSCTGGIGVTENEALQDIMENGINLGAGDYVDVEALKVSTKALKKQIPQKVLYEDI